MGIIFDGRNDPQGLTEVIGQAVGAASVCWTSMEGTGVFDDARARTIVDEVVNWVKTEYEKPNLGLATTAHLLDELRARAVVNGYADYRTVD